MLIQVLNDRPWVQLLLGAFLTTSLLSCGPDEDESSVERTCEGAANHYADLCPDDLLEFVVEEFRLDCAMEESFFSSEIGCLAGSRTCEDAVYCAGDVSFVCDTDSDCALDQVCEDGDCRGCRDDSACEAGKVCAQGLCISEDNSLVELFP